MHRFFFKKNQHFVGHWTTRCTWMVAPCLHGSQKPVQPLGHPKRLGGWWSQRFKKGFWTKSDLQQLLCDQTLYITLSWFSHLFPLKTRQFWYEKPPAPARPWICPSGPCQDGMLKIHHARSGEQNSPRRVLSENSIGAFSKSACAVCSSRKGCMIDFWLTWT